MYKQPIDAVNRRFQLKVDRTCAGVSVIAKRGDTLVTFAQFVEFGKVRVELVRRSQPNAVLYDLPFSKLIDIYGAFYRLPKGVVIPFALKDNLLLSKDSYLQLDISWDEKLGNVTEVSIQENLLAQNTNVPISFKKIAVDGELEVDTEHFEYMYIPATIQKIETFVDGYLRELGAGTKEVSISADLSKSAMGKGIANGGHSLSAGIVDTGHCGCDGQVKRQKIELDYNYMSYISSLPTQENVLFKTEPNQKIKFFGVGEVLLMQA